MSSSARDQLQRLIAESRQMVAFTGAGISTESGIPDFRSPGGIWDQNQPILFQDFVASEEARMESWRRKMAVDPTIDGARPNRGHRALAALHDSDRLRVVITQNVDGLHQESGIPGDRVIELHGNSTYATCLDCHQRFELVAIYKQIRQAESSPRCDRCNGLVKSATISFGQPMPTEAMARAETEARRCDLFLVLGSSLVVYPAAGLPIEAKRSGATLAILNREPTDLDPIADLVVHGEIGPTLGPVVDAL